MTPGGQPDASRRRQYSQHSNTACRMPVRSRKCPVSLARMGPEHAC